MYDPKGIYKITGKKGKPHHGGSGVWPLPNGKPGEWRWVEGELVPCRHGLHLVRGVQILKWFGPELYVAEIGKGDVIEDAQKLCVRRARLVAKVETWNDTTARLFAADCAERALRERGVKDERCWDAVWAARQYALGNTTGKKLDAAWAATLDAAWDTARGWDAAWAAARAAARGAAWVAARGAAWAAARDAARNPALDTARDAAWAAERSWQHERLFEYLNEERS